MQTIYDRLKSYAALGRISFAMPGHKGGAGIPQQYKSSFFELDVTELPDTENLHAPGKVIREAEERLARIYKNDGRSFFLTGGASEGIHIMINAACAGGKLIVNRTCHRSVTNCCVISGTVPVYARQEINKELLVPESVSAEEIAECIRKNPDAKAVLVTSPSFYGQIADIKAISEVCHSNGLALLVDEAHGAHFAAEAMPPAAISLGADMSVCSAHKTLNAPNQTAFLHISEKFRHFERACEMTSMIGTTSPSYPMIAQAQLAAEELTGDAWRNLSEYINTKKQQLEKNSRVVMPKGNIDPARVVVGLRNYDITGYMAEEILRRDYNIDIEMSDYKNIVCIITPSNTKEEIDKLFGAVQKICQSAGDAEKTELPLAPVPEPVISPREAFYAEGELVLPQNACGRISKSAICAYPPGIPIVCQGERISGEIIEYMNAIKKLGASIEGTEPDGRIRVVSERL